jgi:hypothetical protein
VEINHDPEAAPGGAATIAVDRISAAAVSSAM